MKILLTSDLHIKKGIFVDIGLVYLDYISAYVIDNKIDFIVFLGDIFEKSSKIYNEAFVPVFHKFNEMKEQIGSFLLGNHDIYSANKENSIVEVFKPFSRVVSDYYADNKIGYLAYTKNERELPEEKLDYLFTHLAIADFKFDNNYHVNERIAFKLDLFNKYKLVFSGHFHRHQYKDNIVYVGSPYQLTFNEVNTKKGFVVLETENSEWEFVEYDGAPQFLKITADDIKILKTIDFRNKFVKIKIDKKIDEFLKLKHILYEKGALDVVPEFESMITDISVKDSENEIDMSMSIPDIIKDYINNIEDEKINNKKLLKIFDNVVKEV